MKGKVLSVAPRNYEYQGAQRSTYDVLLDIGDGQRTYSYNKGNTLSVGQEIEFEDVKQGNYYRIQNIKGMAQEQKKWGGKSVEERTDIKRMASLKAGVEYSANIKGSTVNDVIEYSKRFLVYLDTGE